MAFRLKNLQNSEIDLQTLEAITFCLTILFHNPCKTIKSSWARKYALEVGICAELNLISLKSNHHQMSRDSRIKIVTEIELLDFSLGAWNLTPKGRSVLNEIKENHLKSIRFRHDLLEQDPHGDHESYYSPVGW